MLKTKKVRLFVDKEYHNKFMQFAGSSRYAFNWAKFNSDEYKKTHDKDIKDGELRKLFTIHKKEPGNEWMNTINNDVFKQGIRDYCDARLRYHKKLSNKPKFKSKNHSKCKHSFYVDTDKIKIIDGMITIPSIGKFKYSGYKLPDYYLSRKNKSRTYIGVKPVNPRVSYDGINWYLSLGYEEPIVSINKNNTSIGVDLGLKTFATIYIDNLDDNNISEDFYEISSLSKKYKELAKRKKRLDRKVSKQNLKQKKGIKSKNYYKLLQKRLKITHKMTNIQLNNIYQTVNFMVKAKPMRIVIEDLNVKGMMKNDRLAKWVSFNQFYKFKTHLQFKCEYYGIELVLADRWFPSSKTCYKCGNKKKTLSLSERTYICEVCGEVIDRDLNAAINLSRYNNQ